MFFRDITGSTLFATCICLPTPPAPATVRVHVFTPQEFADSPDADNIFQGNVPLIMALISGTITTNATFSIV